jgi:hypothetical protein
VQVGGKEGGLVSTGAGADLDDRSAVIERVVRHEEGLHVGLQRGDQPFEARDLGPSFRGQLRVLGRQELTGLTELVLGPGEFSPKFDDASQPLVLPA